MTRRIKLQDGEGGTYAFVDVGLGSTPKIVRVRFDYLLSVGLVLFLLVYFAALEVVRPHFFLHDDNASFYLPDFVQTSDTLFRTGQLAEVNFYQYGGEPIIELGQSGVLYPPSYLCVALARLLGDGRWTVDFVIVLHFIVGALGLFAWLRQRGTDPVLACFGASLFILSPFVLLVCSNGCAFAYTVAYLPWIFCALDRLVQKPGLVPALLTAVPLVLYFYTGAVQIYAYALLFAALYVALNLTASLRQNCMRVTWFVFAVALVTVFISPLLLPILHATSIAVQRSHPLYLGFVLEQSLDIEEFIKTQFFWFGKESIPTSNSSLFLCPELLLVPVAVLGLQRQISFSQAWRFLLLAVIALLLSTWVHMLLSLLPVFDRFRWPFKVFIFWKFFLLLFIFTGLTGWLGKIAVLRRTRRRILVVLSALILAVSTGVVLFEQDDVLFSHTRVPGLRSDLAGVVDPLHGRVMAVGKFVNDGRDLYRYAAYRYGTLFGLPSIGGYNPLVGRDVYDFGMRLNIPNIYLHVVYPNIRDELNRKCVRYLLVNPHTLNGKAALRLDGTRVLLSDPDRVVLENLQAAPMIVSTASEALDTFAYRGNSLVVPLAPEPETIGVSLCPSANWWYRVDGGAWMRPELHDDRVWCAMPGRSHQLEVRYFDAAFQAGLMLFIDLVPLALAILIALGWIERRKVA